MKIKNFTYWVLFPFNIDFCKIPTQVYLKYLNFSCFGLNTLIRWNLVLLCLLTSILTSQIAPTWRPLLQNLIRSANLFPIKSFGASCVETCMLLLTRKGCSWVWQCRPFLSWWHSSSPSSLPSPWLTGWPTTTPSTRKSFFKRDFSKYKKCSLYEDSLILALFFAYVGFPITMQSKRTSFLKRDFSKYKDNVTIILSFLLDSLFCLPEFLV